MALGLEMRGWTDLRKPLAGWRRDTEQEGIEIGKKESKEVTEKTRAKYWVPGIIKKPLRDHLVMFGAGLAMIC